MKKFLAVLLLIGLGAYFIWPTRYQDYRAGTGPYAEQLGNRASRVDRLTGNVFVLDAKGEWVQHEVQKAAASRPDATGPPARNRTDTSPAHQQMNIQKDMQKTTNEMLDEAVKDAKATQ